MGYSWVIGQMEVKKPKSNIPKYKEKIFYVYAIRERDREST